MKLLPNLANYQIILGSQSPRRRQLLSDLGIDFIQRSKAVEESYPTDIAKAEVPLYLSQKKAAAFKDELLADQLLITSDTVVILEDRILEKASSYDEAEEMLKSLSGKMHRVVSGTSLTTKAQQISFAETTKVFFKPLSEAEIAYYLEVFQPYDKAGAYGIQEWIGFIGVEKIEGCYYNVMGLPLSSLYEKLKAMV